MRAEAMCPQPPASGADAVQSRRGLRRRVTSAALLGAVVVLAANPAGAQAHGPIAPVASSYFAKVLALPAGIEAQVVDGDLRMWLRVPAAESVAVLDYRGAPYLEFSRRGVAVNRNSAMYYLNQTPFAQTPPANLTARTPPSWHRVSEGHAYEWHDGRLHALATVALAPGASFVGRWSVPLRVDGRPAAIAGGLWHAEAPSIMWFWPIVVLLACVLAARRVHRRRLDVLIARTLAMVGLLAVAIAGFGLQLHGRPGVSIFQLVELGFILAFVAWGLWRVLLGGPGYFAAFLIAVGAIWAGAVLIPTLLHGFVLIALPAFLTRAVAVICLAAGAGLLLLVFRLLDHDDPYSARPRTRRRVEREARDVESLA